MLSFFWHIHSVHVMTEMIMAMMLSMRITLDDTKTMKGTDASFYSLLLDFYGNILLRIYSNTQCTVFGICTAMKKVMAMRKIQNDTMTNTNETNAHLMSLIIDTCTVTTKLVMFIMLAMMRIIQDDTKKNTDGKKTPCFLNASTESS